MAFGLGKSEKRPDEDEAPEETLEGDAEAATDASDQETARGPFTPAGPKDGPAEDRSQRERISFRPAFLDDSQPRETPTSPPHAQGPPADAFFISVSRDGTTEIHRFDDPAQAQSFIAELLEQGIPQEEVTAFGGRKLALKVTHRPTVKLAGSQQD